MKLATQLDRTRYIAFLQGQPLPLDVDCKPWAEPRTLKANAYMWRAIYKPLVEAAGFTRDDWHEYFCEKYFGTRDKLLPSGEVRKVPRRTTTHREDGKKDVLTGKVFADFLLFVESECAKRGVFVNERWAP